MLGKEHAAKLLKAGRRVVVRYGRTSWMMRRRPGKPTEIRSDFPSHVTSVRTTINATRAIVRRRDTVIETYSRGPRPAGSEPFGASPLVVAQQHAAELLEPRCDSRRAPRGSSPPRLPPPTPSRLPGGSPSSRPPTISEPRRRQSVAASTADASESCATAAASTSTAVRARVPLTPRRRDNDRRPPPLARHDLDAAQLGALLTELGDDYRPFGAMLAYARLRVSEALAVRWRDLDLETGRLRRRATRPERTHGAAQDNRERRQRRPPPRLRPRAPRAPWPPRGSRHSPSCRRDSFASNAPSEFVPGIAPDTPRPTAATPRSLRSSPAAVARAVAFGVPQSGSPGWGGPMR
jgi:hypothetical protein